MKKLFILFVFLILVASNVEAYHSTNKQGRYDDQNLKNHKSIVVINNNYNIHNNKIIQRDSYRDSRYSSYNRYSGSNRYSKYNSRSRYSDRDYRTSRSNNYNKYSKYNSRYSSYKTSKYSRSKHYTGSYKSRYDNYRRSKSYRVRDSVYVF